MPSALPTESRSPVNGHVPVLADEVVGLLQPRLGETVVDCTFGAGGHARRLAPALGEDGRYVAIDQDPEASTWFASLAEDVVCETRFIRADFADALPRLAAQGLRADAVLMDLGISSMQVDRPERGFSYSRQAPLDMRMDPDRPGSAADLVARATERELAEIMRTYGEERYARPIARAIVRRRAEAPIDTTGDLVEIVRSAVPTPAQFAAGHPAKRVFQALRIAVNEELDSLRAGLVGGLRAAQPGRAAGRDQLPLARGPHGQALHGGAPDRLHLPAGHAGLRLRAHARGAVADDEGGPPAAGRARPEPARPPGPPARPGARGMSPPRARGGLGLDAPLARRRPGGERRAGPRPRPGRPGAPPPAGPSPPARPPAPRAPASGSAGCAVPVIALCSPAWSG